MPLQFGNQRFGEAFGATIRKFIDTEYSALMHNLIQLVPDEIYAEFCKYVQENHPDGKITTASLRQTFQAFAEGGNYEGEFSTWLRYDRNVSEAVRDRRVTWMKLFQSAVNCIPDSDLKEMADTFNWVLKVRA